MRCATRPGAVCLKVARDNARKILVSVTDQGEGIPPHLHRAIFEKFHQIENGDRRRGSAGLGLAFCKLAVEAWGGRIGVYSDVGKGSAFFFTLPTSKEQ